MGQPIMREQQRCWLTVRLYDRMGRLEAPTAVHYRIDCVTTGTQLRDWTNITPAPIVEIEVSSEENRILGANEREERRVTVVADYGNDDLLSDEYTYTVRNLPGVT